MVARMTSRLIDVADMDQATRAKLEGLLMADEREIEDDPAEMVRHIAVSVMQGDDTDRAVDQFRDALTKFIDARLAAHRAAEGR